MGNAWGSSFGSSWSNAWTPSGGLQENSWGNSFGTSWADTWGIRAQEQQADVWASTFGLSWGNSWGTVTFVPTVVEERVIGSRLGKNIKRDIILDDDKAIIEFIKFFMEKM